MAIELISEITPKNNGDFPMVDSNYIRGGCHQAETYDDMLAIPTSRLKDGCLCVVASPLKQLYTYNKVDNEWTVFSSGGGDGGAAIYDDVTSEIYTWSSQKIASELEERLSLDDVDNVISPTSKKPVQNKVIAEALEEKISKDDVDSAISPYSKNPVQNKVIAEALENVKAGKTMTAEEYDALDDETKNDGSFYYISDTGEIYQNGIIYGGKQIFDVTQEEYDALTDEEKAINEYHCTDTGRIYINGILYGDKKPIELTFEEYKQLEADGLVEPDVDYVIVSDEKGILLASEDVGYKDKTVHEALVTLEGDVENLKEDVATLETDVATKQENIFKKHIASRKEDASDTKPYCLIATLKVSNVTFINEPVIIEGVMGNATSSTQKMLFKASFDFRNGAKETAKVIYGYINQSSLFNHIDLLATFDESAEIAYIYVHHKTNYSMIDADISIPQRNASIYLTMPETFEKTDTIIGTEVHRMSTSTGVKVLAGLDDVNKHSLPLVYKTGNYVNNTVKLFKLANVIKNYTKNDFDNLNLLLSTRRGDEIELITGSDDNSNFVQAYRRSNATTKISAMYRDGYDIYIRVELYVNFFRVYHKSGNLPSNFEVTQVDSIPDTATEIFIRPLPTYVDDTTSSIASTWSSSKIASEINPTIDISKVFSNGALNISTLCNTYGNGRYVIVGQGTAGNGSATIDIWTLASHAISYIVNVTYSNKTSNTFIGLTYENPTINFETSYLSACNHIAKVCTLV